MPFSDVLSADVEGVFFNGDFDAAITYNGASIRAVINTEIQQGFEVAPDLDGDFKTIIVKSSDVPEPVVVGRGDPDVVTLPGDAQEWYVHRITRQDGQTTELIIGTSGGGYMA